MDITGHTRTQAHNRTRSDTIGHDRTRPDNRTLSDTTGHYPPDISDTDAHDTVQNQSDTAGHPRDISGHIPDIISDSTGHAIGQPTGHRPDMDRTQPDSPDNEPDRPATHGSASEG